MFSAVCRVAALHTTCPARTSRSAAAPSGSTNRAFASVSATTTEPGWLCIFDGPAPALSVISITRTARESCSTRTRSGDCRASSSSAGCEAGAGAADGGTSFSSTTTRSSPARSIDSTARNSVPHSAA